MKSLIVSEKLLWVKFDNKLKLIKHVSSLCKKANPKLHIKNEELLCIYKFSIWILSSGLGVTLNILLNKFQERSLHIVNPMLSMFDEFLQNSQYMN